MFTSLTELLEDGEALMYPIYGILHQGNTQRYGFFGFTENCLLIALTTGREITYTIKVPLDIKSIKIKRGAVLRQYTIDISFNEGAPCRIVAYPRVLTIDTQKDNLPQFLEYLREKSPAKNQPSFKNIKGTKIRLQIFNILIYMLLSFVPATLIMTSVLNLKAGKFDWLFLAEGLLIWGQFLLPFIVLSLINAFFIGKTVCVLNEKGVYLENDFIPWKNIKKIEYHPEMPKRYRANYTYASFLIEGSEVDDYRIEVLHFPIYGLMISKKYAPLLKIELAKGKKLSIAFFALFPSVLALIMALFG